MGTETKVTLRRDLALCCLPSAWALNCENQVLNGYKLLIHLVQLFCSNTNLMHEAGRKSHVAFVRCKIQILMLLLCNSYSVGFPEEESKLFSTRLSLVVQQSFVGNINRQIEVPEM